MIELSGDKHLNGKEKIYYLFSNFIKGFFSNFVYLKTKYLNYDENELNKDSPGRSSLNQFLKKELNKISPEKRIKILDIGCGSGYIRKLLIEMGYTGYYTGVDIYEHKDFKKYSYTKFENNLIISKIEDYLTEDKYDLVLTNFVLEHIENDTDTLIKCDNLVDRNGKQIHILPSFWSLFLYLWHGYRQYNPLRIKKLFNNKKYKVYRITGFFSFFLHLFSITIPEILLKKYRFRNLTFYIKLKYICNKFDKYLPILSYVYVTIVE